MTLEVRHREDNYSPILRVADRSGLETQHCARMNNFDEAANFSHPGAADQQIQREGDLKADNVKPYGSKTANAAPRGVLQSPARGHLAVQPSLDRCQVQAGLQENKVASHIARAHYFTHSLTPIEEGNMAAHQQDVQALDRILLRLGLTEEDKLSAVSHSSTIPQC